MFEEINRQLVEIAVLIGRSDVDEVAEICVRLNEIKDNLRLVREDADNHLIELMGDKPEIRAGGKRIEISPSAPRKQWKHKGLTEIVMQRLKDLAIDDNGELKLTPDEAADRLQEFAHIDYWRVKKLKEIDVNPDNFCEVGDEKKTVRINDY